MLTQDVVNHQINTAHLIHELNKPGQENSISRADFILPPSLESLKGQRKLEACLKLGPTV
jgi:hypothetical protein